MAVGGGGRWLLRLLKAAVAGILVLALLSLVVRGDDLSGGLVSGCVSRFVEDEEPIVFSLALEVVPNSFIPLVFEEGEAGQREAALVGGLFFEPLVRLNGAGELLPGLAVAWESGDGARTWTLKLREGVTWHDGFAFNADDVVFTFKTLADPALPGGRFWFWKDISLTAEDPVTVSFSLPAPDPFFPYELTSICIMPEHLLAGVHPEDWAASGFSKAPVGTGPFRYLRLEGAGVGAEDPSAEEPGDTAVGDGPLRLVAVANEDYYGGAVASQRFEVLWPEEGDTPLEAVVRGDALLAFATPQEAQVLIRDASQGDGLGSTVPLIVESWPGAEVVMVLLASGGAWDGVELDGVDGADLAETIFGPQQQAVEPVKGPFPAGSWAAQTITGYTGQQSSGILSRIFTAQGTRQGGGEGPAPVDSNTGMVLGFLRGLDQALMLEEVAQELAVQLQGVAGGTGEMGEADLQRQIEVAAVDGPGLLKALMEEGEHPLRQLGVDGLLLPWPSTPVLDFFDLFHSSSVPRLVQAGSRQVIAGANLSGFSDPEVDALLEEYGALAATPDLAGRRQGIAKELNQALQAALSRGQGALFLWSPLDYAVANREIAGFRPGPYALLWNPEDLAPQEDARPWWAFWRR